MLTVTAIPLVLAALAFGSLAQETTQETTAVDEPFPASTALAEGLSPEALAELSLLVQGFVDDGEVVGAELLVIRNGRSVLHEAYGWRDREGELPMEVGSVFCVRSMTKPVIAAAILMLVDDKQLELDDRVGQYLTAFDVEGTAEITVEQLLTHTSGLPMSLILGRNLRELESIQAVAELGAGYQLAFEPGSAFGYSDQGTDTLTALLEVVGGMPAEEFVHKRVLEPLGMRESACLMTEDHPLRARVCSGYLGTRWAWTRFWGPDDPVLFPIFLGSQGLYSTLEDYARFMTFWSKRGRAGRQSLLRSRFVRQALTPGPYPLDSPTGLPGLRTDYGYLMQLWTEPRETAETEETDDDSESGQEQQRKVVAFGHTGSDGTHAWVFPEQDALVLYFSQSRGNLTGLRVEEALGELLLGVPYDTNEAAPPFEPYLGYYWEGEGDLYRAIVRDGEDLALEIMGEAVVQLIYAGGERWKFRANPGVVLEFQRSETGAVSGYQIGDHREYRFEPASELPAVDELEALVARTHRLDLMESLGPIRLLGSLEIERFNMMGEVTTCLEWPDRFRVDSITGEQYERLAFDGEQIRYSSSDKPVSLLEGPESELVRLENPFARLGGWRSWYPEMQVIQRLEHEGRDVVLVRVGDTSGPGRTLYVDLESGQVLREDSMTHVDTIGRTGQRLTFGDYRETSGMLLPHRTETVLANPMTGRISVDVRIEQVELGVELPAGIFELSE